MDIRSKRDVTITVTFTEREAKMLGCLIGALSPLDTEVWIKKGMNYSRWLGTVDTKEVSAFTEDLYEGLHQEFK